MWGGMFSAQITQIDSQPLDDDEDVVVIMMMMRMMMKLLAQIDQPDTSTSIANSRML